ncbi:DUF3209 family protein [Dyella humi]|uniref:DUF3209 family protein n=1 Tax=Dyella humi TaxID=1770547 RepID=A0ABW8IEZ6_9GAMM
MEISIQTLAVCVRAVDAKARELQEQIAASDDPELSYLEEELLSYSKAESELERLYIEAQKTARNFPPYDELL